MHGPCALTLDVSGISADEIHFRLGEWAASSGFPIEGNAPATRREMLPRRGNLLYGTEFRSERGLQFNRRASRRNLGVRLAGFLIALAAGVWGWVESSTVHQHASPALFILAVLAAVLGPVIVVIIAVTTRSDEFWSEVVIVEYSGRPSFQGSPGDLVATPATYHFRIVAGHAVSRNYATKIAVGRRVRRAYDSPASQQYRNQIAGILRSSGNRESGLP
jgi:hypothetical protein